MANVLRFQSATIGLTSALLLPTQCPRTIFGITAILDHNKPGPELAARMCVNADASPRYSKVLNLGLTRQETIRCASGSRPERVQLD